LKFATHQKKQELDMVLAEYGRVVNLFIDHFWTHGVIPKAELLKPIVDLPETWLSARLRKVAAREALDMTNSVMNVQDSNQEQLEHSVKTLESKISNTKPTNRWKRCKINTWHINIKRYKDKLRDLSPTKPKHKGKRMNVSCTIAELQRPKGAGAFDAWLHITSVGQKISLDLPVKFHRHFNDLRETSKRLNAYIITRNSIQFVFEQETGPKRTVKHLLGVDTGINALASLSSGRQLGKDIKNCIERIKRCRCGSKGYKRAQSTLKQKIDKTAKDLVSKQYELIVVENFKNLAKLSKVTRRVTKNIRRSIGIWNYRYWLMRVQQQCERNRVSFRTVSPAYTSQRCSKCGYTDRRNRNGERFRCQKCESTGNADTNAARNILFRFLSGPYGAGYKPLCSFLQV